MTKKQLVQRCAELEETLEVLRGGPVPGPRSRVVILSHRDRLINRGIEKLRQIMYKRVDDLLASLPPINETVL